MKKCLSILSVAISLAATGQPLRNINFNYLYDPNQAFSFDMRAIKRSSEWTVFYQLTIRDTTHQDDDFTIQWEIRKSVSENEGQLIAPEIQEMSRSKKGFSGSVSFTLTEESSRIIVAKVINVVLKRAWLFCETLDPQYPVDGILMHQGVPLLKPYVNLSQPVQVNGADTLIVSYYNDDFPVASPPFAVVQPAVSESIKPDSVFLVRSGDTLQFDTVGLYLLQRDTTAISGFAFRVEDDYPKLARIQSLAAPFIYITTKQEYERFIASKNDKRSFDRNILRIVDDAERARTLIRNYFRRVELANLYFTSFKEGWKTDRGMTYIVFGLPNEVYKLDDREIWVYRNEWFRAVFTFFRVSSVFDARNYVLERDRRYQSTWYEVIDLWRKARF